MKQCLNLKIAILSTIFEMNVQFFEMLFFSLFEVSAVNKYLDTKLI